MRQRRRVVCLSAAVTLGLSGISCSDMPPSAADPESVTEPGAIRGVFLSATADYFDEGRSEKLYALRRKDGSLVGLQFSGVPGIDVGSEVVVYGTQTPNGVLVDRFNLVKNVETDGIGRQQSRVIDPVPLSPPLKAAFVSLTPAYTKEMLSARLLKDDFIKQVMEVTSYGRWTMEFEVFGPFTVPNDCGGTFYDNLGKNGVAAMQAAGVDTTPFKQIQFIIGSSVPACTWGGFGYDGKTPIRTDGERGMYNPWSYVKGDQEGVMVQEIGHNWGLAHEHFCPGTGAAGQPPPKPGCTGYVEYGSPFTPMSSSNNVYLNAWERIQMNFFSGCNVLTVGQSGTYEVGPSTLACNGPQILRVAADKGTDAQRYYYLEYRVPVGIEKTNGVVVHYSADIKQGGWTQCDWGGPDCPEDFLINPKGGPRTEALLTAGYEWTTPEGVGIKIASLGDTAKFDLTFPTQGAAPFCLDNSPWDSQGPVCKAGPPPIDGGTPPPVDAGRDSGGGADAGRSDAGGAGGGSTVDSGGPGGEAGTAGTGGSGGSAGGSSGSAGTSPPPNDSGCGCRVPSSRSSGGFAALGLATALGAMARRRRRPS